MSEIIRFDDSLPALIRVISEELGSDATSQGIALRDTTGRLAFLMRAHVAKGRAKLISRRLFDALGPYARKDRVFASGDDFGVEEALSDPTAAIVMVNGIRTRLLDRRLVGADWLRSPSPPAPPPPRYVFASLKGGVGRSTALAVAAADFASRGRRVLVVDLDMEAPGLGAMLLDEGTVPEFGLIDALVENGLAPLDDKFLADLIGPSSLADRRGRIDVMPAFGRRSLNFPGDVLSKIARAYAENVSESGSVATILDQVRALVDRVANPRLYDAVLVDSRAGLHETAASAILGLGAEIFLFGLNEPQTFQGYAALFSHLKRFIDPIGTPPEWIERLTMVQGKALPNSDDFISFRERCEKLFSSLGLVAAPPASSKLSVPLPAAPFSDVPWDDSVSDSELGFDYTLDVNDPIAILSDERFHLFEPTHRRDLLTEEIYRGSFGPLLNRMNEIFASGNEERH